MLRTLRITSAATLAAVVVADFMSLTLLVGSAEQHAVATEALLSDGAVLVEGALWLAATVDADVVIRAVHG